MLESRSGIFLIAGVGFFALAFLSNGLVPLLMYKDQVEARGEDLLNDNIMLQYKDLAYRYPSAFLKHHDPEAFAALGLTSEDPAAFRPSERILRGLSEDHEGFNWTEEKWRAKCVESLHEGRRIYVGEGCWHCHSQFVRPVSNESLRWGPVAQREEYDNELQRPVLFGTRRVGPDLSREGGRRGNDWHVVHFFRPRLTSPESVMPDYPWFFEGRATVKAYDNRGRMREVEGPLAPNRRGFALITYTQWLGSWHESYPHYNLPGLKPEGDAP